MQAQTTLQTVDGQIKKYKNFLNSVELTNTREELTAEAMLETKSSAIVTVSYNARQHLCNN